jgi:hypothetical protein
MRVKSKRGEKNFPNFLLYTKIRYGSYDKCCKKSARCRTHFSHLLAGPQRVPHLAHEGLVVPAGGRGAEDAHGRVRGVGVDVVEAARHLHLQQGVEGVFAAVQDLGLDLQPLAAAHQVGVQPVITVYKRTVSREKCKQFAVESSERFFFMLVFFREQGLLCCSYCY